MRGGTTIVRLPRDGQMSVAADIGWWTYRSQLQSVFSRPDHGEWSSYQEQQCSASLGKDLAMGPGTGHEK